MYDLLHGARIVELSHILMAPFGTQFLGDFGADVVKVEPATGDYYRWVGNHKNRGMSAQWMNVNRNKRSVVLDLRSDAGREAMMDLIKAADAFVHNIRPGGIQRLGLAYEDLKQVNPGIVYCVACGFGSDGPYSGRAAFDDIIQSQAGFAHCSRDAAGNPRLLQVTASDAIGGLFLAQSVVAGLYHRKTTGEGVYIETPMFETSVSIVMNQHLAGHTFEPPIADMGYGRVMSQHRNPTATSDGFIVHGIYKRKHWLDFMRHIGRSDIADGPMLKDDVALGENIAALYRMVGEDILPTRSTAEWAAILDEHEIPWAPVNTFDDLMNDPHLKAVDFFHQYDHPTEGPTRSIRLPYHVEGMSQMVDLPPPGLGTHTKEVLLELGWPKDRVQAVIDETTHSPELTSEPQT